MKRKRHEQMHRSGCQVESGQPLSVHDEDASNFPDGEGIEGAIKSDSRQEAVDQRFDNGKTGRMISKGEQSTNFYSSQVLLD